MYANRNGYRSTWPSGNVIRSFLAIVYVRYSIGSNSNKMNPHNELPCSSCKVRAAIVWVGIRDSRKRGYGPILGVQRRFTFYEK